MPKTYEPIASTTLTAGTASVTFSSIPQTYTDLVVVMSASVSSGAVGYRVGNTTVDTGSNYSRTNLYGDGATAASTRQTGQTALYVTAATSSSNFSANIIHFMNYSNTTTNKTFLARANDASVVTVIGAHLWRSTVAINTITFFGEGANIASGSSFTLYGVKSA